MIFKKDQTIPICLISRYVGHLLNRILTFFQGWPDQKMPLWCNKWIAQGP